MAQNPAGPRALKELSIRNKKMSLGDERLSTTDQKGRRLFIYPAEAKGHFRNLRNTTNLLLIIFFLGVPWMNWNGRQLFLLDVKDKVFYFFDLVFRAHDAPLIFVLLAIGTISLGLVTALFGRVWCGWSCPQTVFIDGVYRKIETWVLGDYIQKRKLAQSPWHFRKIRKTAWLWFLYFFVSAVIAHSFAAYFVGSHRLLLMLSGPPFDHFSTFLTVVVITGILLFNFGWFREQFCLIACPYGRIQSVLMDKSSLSVLYNVKRGEPRREAGAPKSHLQGDCVNCRRCIEVCPTGIDIRRGIQMECIGCTACIDACDEIMAKVKKPAGLISYASEVEMENSITLTWKQRLLKPRVILYAAGIFMSLLVFSNSLQRREPLLVNILKTKEAPYTLIVENGDSFILNHFKLHIHHQSSDPLILDLAEDQKSEYKIIAPQRQLRLEPGESKELHFFVKFPSNLLSHQGTGSAPLDLQVVQNEKILIIQKELHLIGPLR